MTNAEIDALIASKVLGWPEGIAWNGEYPRDIGCHAPVTPHAFWHTTPRENWSNGKLGCMWCWALYDDPVHDNSLPYGKPTKSYPYTFHSTVFYEEHGSGAKWQPSVDIEQAWMVVAKLRKEFFIEMGCNQAEWWVTLGGVHHARAETAPLAICRAALLTVEHS